MNRTIPEIADMLGVDKGRIYRLLKKIDIKPVRNEPNLSFGEPEQKLIEQYLFDNSSSHQTRANRTEPNANQKRTDSEPKTNSNQTKNESNDKIIDVLIAQLKQKDNQIDSLQTLLSQQQQLTLQDKQTIENQAKKIESLSVRNEPNRTENEPNANQKRTENEPKHNFWNFFKNKKEG